MFNSYLIRIIENVLENYIYSKDSDTRGKTMSNEFDPLIDQWYAYLDKGQRFFVTAINDAAKTVEIQNFDGDIDELTFDEWTELNIELSVEPENWSGALDVGEQDDLGTEVTDTNQEDWDEPLEDFRSAGKKKSSSEPEASADDYGEGYPEEEPLK